ncbi:MAG TPA: hypothetical protein VNX02_17795 [Steroidobacteraceae bacterium]|nr:hypothetical protein [Steroidobacteraceae bacterium]
MLRLISTVGLLSALSIIALEDTATATGNRGISRVEDPFAYCARVNTIDTPLGGASPIPPALAPFLRKTLGLSADAPLTPESSFWRCMDGAVYVCAIGANLRCDAKADRASRNAGADNYCRENPNATFVPAYATGHDTIYAWSCSAGGAVPGNRTIKVDRRGYRADIWHRVLPSQSGALPFRLDQAPAMV